MSYDIYLKDPDGATHEFKDAHKCIGGTYAVGGTTEPWLNVTYNYSKHFYRVMGDDGVRSIYGKTGKQSITLLDAAIAQLGDDVDNNYWKPTEGNAKAALMNLKTLAEAAPNCVWAGD